MLIDQRNRITTLSSPHQNINVRPYSYVSSSPRLLTYDVFEEKSVQQLLCEAAQDHSRNDDKWEMFTNKLQGYMSSKKLSKQVVKTLDEKKQWAPLHYAVYHNNMSVVNKLTARASEDKQFQCDINILTGNGENVLHIAARSTHIWEDASSTKSTLQGIALRSPETVQLPQMIIDLIDRGADVEHVDDEYRTPLHLAIMNNRLPLVKYLLHKGADIYAKTKLHANALHMTFIPGRQKSEDLASMLHYLDKQIIYRSSTGFPWREAPENLSTACTLENRTPLVLAVCHPSITREILEKLISMMQTPVEDTEGQMQTFQTQILMAVERVSRRSLRDHDFLITIAQQCQIETRQLLFHFPCRYNNLPLLQWLIEQPLSKEESKNNTLNLNQGDHAGYTPLLTAVFYGSTNCVKYLLQKPSTSARTNIPNLLIPAAIEKTNFDGENILHICAKHSVPQSLLELIWSQAVDHGLLSRRDSNGNLPFHIAAGSNQIDFCNLVLSRKEDGKYFRFEKNFYGQTVAHVATEAVPRRIGPEHHSASSQQHNNKIAGHHTSKNSKDDDDDDDHDHDFGLPVLRRLWDGNEKGNRNSGLFERDDDGYTCLHSAAARGQYKIVKFLVEEVGLEIDAIADRYLTPLHLACQSGHHQIVAYLIEHGASATQRNAELYNCLEVAIMNQHEEVVQQLLTLPNWRELMRNAQKIPHTEAFDTPMRKLIRYMPKVTLWMIETNLTRRLGGPEKNVFKIRYDYEFYDDTSLVKKWHTQGADGVEKKETCGERWDRRGCGALCCCGLCCQGTSGRRSKDMLPYTDDAYTLVRNHPLFIVSLQSACPDLVEHPYNTCLRDDWFKKYGFYIVRTVTFIAYLLFLGMLTAIIVSGKHPQYFYAKTNRNMTNDIYTCQIVSNNLTAANDSEALKTNTYRNIKWVIYVVFILYLLKNAILIISLFPKVFRSIEYYLEVSALVLSYVYVLDWYDWQSPLIFRCPIQYQIGAMGILLAYINMLTYVRRFEYFNIGIFVTMLQLIFFKFVRFIYILLIVICGFGFAYWMLLQNQDAFQSPGEALMRTGILTFELNYEDHLYKDQYYYPLVFVVVILSAIVFPIFILNLLISLAVGEIPSLTEQGKLWRSQMLYNLLSDYSIASLQCIRLLNCLSCGKFRQMIIYKLIRGGKPLKPIVVIEREEGSSRLNRMWNHIQKNFFNQQIQDNITPNINTMIEKKDEK